MKQAAGQLTIDDYVQGVSSALGLHLCIYDVEDFLDTAGLVLSKRNRTHSAPFCEAIKGSSQGLSCCIHDDHRSLQSVPEDQACMVSRCHAGLVQLVVPLRFNGKLMGGLFWGPCQLRSSRLDRMQLQDLAVRFRLPLEALERAAESVPVTTLKRLRESRMILLLLRDHILACHRLRKTLPRFPFEGKSSMPSTISLAMLPPPPLLRSDFSPAIRTAVETIRKNYWLGLTREALAEEISLSPSQFSRRFKSETGLCFRRYVQQSQISAAAYLLKHTQLTVEDIARKVGFSSSAAFNRSFRSLTGFSPREFMFANAKYPWKDE